jgi:hypothetical protein
MQKIIVVLTILIAIPLASYALAGFFERYLEMMDVLYSVLKTILFHRYWYSCLLGSVDSK